LKICFLAALLVSDGETLGLLLGLQLSLVCDKALYLHPSCLPYILTMLQPYVDHKVNYLLYYTRDILLLAPTLTALQKLLYACEHELYLIDMAINFKKCSCLRVGQRYYYYYYYYYYYRNRARSTQIKNNNMHTLKKEK